MASIDPKTLLEQLCQNAHPRKVASLRLIYGLCEEQHERGSRDFSIATIGRLSQTNGGPSAAAIRNKTGDGYKALMKAFAEHVGGQTKKNVDKRLSATDELLEGVTDPVLRARIGILVAELESARVQLMGLRHLANKTTVLKLDNQENTLGSDTDANAGTFSLSDQERLALQRAIAPATLEHWGWISESSGRIRTESGQVVYPAGYMTAIRKVLDADAASQL